MKLKNILFSLLCLLSFPAFAGSMSLSVPNLFIRIHDDKPCQLINDARFKRADVVHQGKSLKACWANADESHIVIFDETRDAGILPKTQFKVDKPI